MTETEVVRSMVCSFRLHELQTLLQFAGRSKAGRKTDLQARALEVVKLNDVKVMNKIKELSGAMYSALGGAASVNPYSENYVGGNVNRASADEGRPPDEPQEQAAVAAAVDNDEAADKSVKGTAVDHQPSQKRGKKQKPRESGKDTEEEEPLAAVKNKRNQETRKDQPKGTKASKSSGQSKGNKSRRAIHSDDEDPEEANRRRRAEEEAASMALIAELGETGGRSRRSAAIAANAALQAQKVQDRVLSKHGVAFSDSSSDEFDEEEDSSSDDDSGDDDDDDGDGDGNSSRHRQQPKQPAQPKVKQRPEPKKTPNSKGGKTVAARQNPIKIARAGGDHSTEQRQPLSLVQPVLRAMPTANNGSAEASNPLEGAPGGTSNRPLPVQIALPRACVAPIIGRSNAFLQQQQRLQDGNSFGGVLPLQIPEALHNPGALPSTSAFGVPGSLGLPYTLPPNAPDVQRCGPYRPYYPQQQSSKSGFLLYPTYPDVTMKNLPFYDVLDTLLRPVSLQPQNQMKTQEQTFSFFLTPQHIKQIELSGYRDELGRPDYKKQVQLRFGLLETSCEQMDNFPNGLIVKINGRSQPLTNPIPSTKPGVEAKRPPKALNISNLIKFSATSPNTINVAWLAEVGHTFTLSVYLVEKLSSQDLIAKLKQKGQRHPDYTRAVIKDKLNDKDSEIATTSCKVSLACPLGKMRMRMPCRSSKCDHLQCFDAANYLLMNEKKVKWLCPVCNNHAPFETLMLDGYFGEILSSRRLPEDEHEIVLQNDASWDPMPAKATTADNNQKPRPAAQQSAASLPSSPKAKKRKVETLDIEDDEPSSSSGSKTTAAPNKDTVECVTLDSSDDDEDGGLICRPALAGDGPERSCESPALVGSRDNNPNRMSHEADRAAATTAAAGNDQEDYIPLAHSAPFRPRPRLLGHSMDSRGGGSSSSATSGSATIGSMLRNAAAAAAASDVADSGRLNGDLYALAAAAAASYIHQRQLSNYSPVDYSSETGVEPSDSAATISRNPRHRRASPSINQEPGPEPPLICLDDDDDY